MESDTSYITHSSRDMQFRKGQMTPSEVKSFS